RPGADRRRAARAPGNVPGAGRAGQQGRLAMSVSTTAPLSLDEVRDELLSLPHPFRREDVHRVVSRLRTTPEELLRYQHWSAEKYTRTRFYEGPRFEILVLCWREGQMSPIHDHANSICSMLVLEGSASTTMYEVHGGALVEEASTALAPGQLTTVYG